MEDRGVLLSALLIGPSIAAPRGPIGLLTFQRSLDPVPRASRGAAVA